MAKLSNHYPFLKLNVWTQSRKVLLMIFPLAEKARNKYPFLTNQIQRAIVSVSANLCEGSSKRSFKEQARFTETAYCSLMEVAGLLIHSNDLMIIDKDECCQVHSEIKDLSVRLANLKNYQLESFKKKKELKRNKLKDSKLA